LSMRRRRIRAGSRKLLQESGRRVVAVYVRRRLATNVRLLSSHISASAFQITALKTVGILSYHVFKFPLYVVCSFPQILECQDKFPFARRDIQFLAVPRIFPSISSSKDGAELSSSNQDRDDPLRRGERPRHFVDND
jgi:hypothetical protein